MSNDISALCLSVCCGGTSGGRRRFSVMGSDKPEPFCEDVIPSAPSRDGGILR